jgi:hypothetical protein
VEKAAPALESVPEPEIQDIQIPAPAQEPEPVVAAHKFAMGGLTGPNYGPVCRFCPNPPGHPVHAVVEPVKKAVPEPVPVEKEAAKVESPEPDLWVADTFQRIHDFLDIAGEKLAEEANRREKVLRSEIETLTSLLETAEAERDAAYEERDRLREQSDGSA